MSIVTAARFSTHVVFALHEGGNGCARIYYLKISQSFLNEDKRRPTKSPSLDTIFLHNVNISKVQHCFTTEGGGAYPPSVATAMFTVACVLLVLPKLTQICTRRFLRNVFRLAFIAALFSLLVAVLLVTTAIQVNRQH